MAHEMYSKEYFDGSQKRGVLTLSNEAFLDVVFDVLKTKRITARSGVDVGCAYGALAAAMHERGVPEMHGIDVSEYAIEEGKKRYPQINLEACNIDANDPPQSHINAYDVIVSLHTFEHCVHPIDALRRTASMLKSNGVFFMIVPNPRIWIGRILKVFGQEKRIPVFGDETHVSLFNRSQWLSTLDEAGFVVEDSLGRPFYTLKYPWVYRLLRGRVYTHILRESGFELLYICRKK